ncbi:MAG: hypothetical protein K9L61_06095 [Candidatus Omnitrophica bacterium]|nr:hypothetical protein [Candidatus Omnitrophota bacterium]
MELTRVSVFLDKGKLDWILANCSVEFDNGLILSGMQLREKKDGGNYLWFPRPYNPKAEDDKKEGFPYYFLKGELFNVVRNAIVDKYNEIIDNDSGGGSNYSF